MSTARSESEGASQPPEGATQEPVAELAKCARASDPATWRVDSPVFLASFVAALAIYFAVVEGAGRINHDMSEAYAWGREFQFGYFQHPPFWAWICGVWFLVFPHEIWAFGLLSAVNAAVGLWASAKLIGDFARGAEQKAATALLLLTPCYTLYAFKYDANIIFISLWPLTAHMFVRAFGSRRMTDALGFGLLAGLSLISKYYALVLLASCAVAALLHSDRKLYFRSASPYVAALTALAVCAPHLVWLFSHQAPPIRYLMSKSGISAGELGSRAALTLVFVARTPPSRWRATWREKAREPRFRMLAALALGPLLLTFVAAFALRPTINAEMVVGIFPLLPLLLIEIVGPPDMDRLARVASRFAAALIVGAVALSPVVSIATTYLSHRAMDVTPSREMAFEATRIWREATGAPLVYVAGADASAESYDKAAAFYSPDRPHAFIGFRYDKSPWVTPEALATHGLLSICRVDDEACQQAAARFSTSQSKTFDVALAHRAWGHVARTFHFILTVTPPQG